MGSFCKVRRGGHPLCLWAFFGLSALAGCKKHTAPQLETLDATPSSLHIGDGGDDLGDRLDATFDGSDGARPLDAALDAAPIDDGRPKLAAIGMHAFVYAKPEKGARRLGYLRLGAVVSRDPEPVTLEACRGGWYKVAPKGYVCVGDSATLDLNHPILRAAGARPNTDLPLPYEYGFVRSNMPLYLRIPNHKEQHRWEYGLKPHLRYYREHIAARNKITPGSNDIPVDADGVVLPDFSPDAPLPDGRKRALDMSLAELFAGRTDSDPVPFWLEGGRQIPNVSAYKVTEKQYFASKVARHAGIAFSSSFVAGPDGYDRRFAVTTDLRLLPADKIKPETGSQFHGVPLSDSYTLPIAWVRRDVAHVYNVEPNVVRTGRTIPSRTVVKLTGKAKMIEKMIYREMEGGGWLKEIAIGTAMRPIDWPPAAGAGQKWIDISIDNETLVLWEGKHPVYATLVSTGQDGAGDPKTTKSTVLGTFEILSKHVTATMDSNGRSDEGGGPPPAPATEPTEASAGTNDDESGGKEERKPSAKEGAFELRDVPYVQYFEAGFAIHAAYWHDAFGTPRSHGCVNLSPIDALRVFKWTAPAVPREWHAVVAGPDVGGGTVVNVRR